MLSKDYTMKILKNQTTEYGIIHILDKILCPENIKN